jgi:ABC-type arginine transport system ATPase subunit
MPTAAIGFTSKTTAQTAVAQVVVTQLMRFAKKIAT